MIKRPPISVFRRLLEAKGGNITQVAKALGVTRQTVHNWTLNYPKFANARLQEAESHLDFLESQKKLLQKGIPEYQEMPDPNDPTKTVKVLVDWTVKPSELLIIFDLKTLGKNRGYSEHLNIGFGVNEVIMPDIPILEDDETAITPED